MQTMTTTINISEDLVDCLEAQVLMMGREGKTPGEIVEGIKCELADMLRVEPMTDLEILAVVADGQRTSAGR